MNFSLKSIFGSLFLGYFLLYAVSPLSATAVPAEGSADALAEGQNYRPAISLLREAVSPRGQSPNVFERRDSHTNLFLFDMVLWEILKKARPSNPSETEIRYIREGSLHSAKDVPPETVEGATTAFVVPSPLPEVGSDNTWGSLLCRAFAGLEYSGLSPPSLS